MKEKSFLAKALKLVSILIIIIGIGFLIKGIINMFSDREPSMVNFPILFFGIFLIVLGSILSQIGMFYKSHHKSAPYDHQQYDSEKTIKCPSCNGINSSQARYCNQCGAKLINFCQFCDTENDYGAEYCSNCGAKLPKQR